MNIGVLYDVVGAHGYLEILAVLPYLDRRRNAASSRRLYVLGRGHH